MSMRLHTRRGWRSHMGWFLMAVLTVAVAYGGIRLATHFMYPLRYRELIFANAAEFQLDPYLVAAIIRTESRWRPGATSPKGARGLMQVMPDTAVWVAEQMDLQGFDPNRLYDPATNIRIGCWYLRYLLNQFGDDEVTALAAYNGGDHNVRRWLREARWTGQASQLNQVPFPETRIYLQRVLRHYQFYVRIYAP